MDSTTFYMLVLYNNAFKYFKLGYASAMAWILLVVVLVLTLLLFRSSRTWVHYAEMEA
jgi:multiple sugar transport system permease protein